MPDYDYQSDTRPFSAVVEDIGVRPHKKLYLGELVDAFGERGFGALMLFLGLLNILVGAVPGTTTILGAPLLLISLQLVTRQDQVWMPKWAMKSSIERATYRNAVGKIMKPLRMVERLSRPRLSVMTSEVSEVLIGAACAALCAILVLPIWGGNLVPALIVATFGFGMMQRDGVVILIAWAGVAGVGVFIWLAWELVSRALMTSWEWLSGLF